MEAKFKTVAVGGTFDTLHRGHKKLLLEAFKVGSFVLIGLSSDKLLTELRKPHKIASYEQRLKKLKKFLEINDLLERTEILSLNDSFGVTLSDNRIEALIVSEETEPRAHQINERRIGLGLSPLPIVTVKMALSEDHYPISSTRIWFEEIDEDGNLL